MSSPTDNDSKSTRLVIEEREGDLFDAPDGTVLIHACNCEGQWGAGIAKQFKSRYKDAFEQYRSHCLSRSKTDDDVEGQDSPIGTALIIPPSTASGPKHYVACLFTSKYKGKKKDNPKVILEHSQTAVVHMLQQLINTESLDTTKSKTKSKTGSDASLKTSLKVAELRMPRINSGLFNVPWEDTKKVLEDVELEEGMPSKIIVFSRG